MNDNYIYMDDAATTAPDPRVVEAMLPWLRVPANAHIRYHRSGAAAAQAVSTARAQIAAVLSCAPTDITFTASATESNNLFLQGIPAHLRQTGKTHIIATAVEHKSVLSCLSAIDGVSVTILPCKPCGMIESSAIKRTITDQTGLITIQAVNNVTGTIQPLREIADAIAGTDIIFHTDAAQALGKIGNAFNVHDHGVHAATISGHKIYGPSGIAALYVHPDIRPSLRPLTHGGGQEDGLRAGTLPVNLCVGMGTACQLIGAHEGERERVQTLRDRLLSQLIPLQPEVFGHSDPQWNVPHILCLRFAGIDHETLLMMLPDLAFSTGSACASQGGTDKNHVITAIAGQDAAAQAIRLSFGRTANEDIIDRAAAMICAAIQTIRTVQEQEGAIS